MLKLEHTCTYGWEAAIRGMRNPMNSWEKSDSGWNLIGAPGTNQAVANDKYLREKYCVGNNDLDLMKLLAKGGAAHAKYRRMINVTVDIVGPLYWWKEFDTYKVGTVANSCSTMHKIHAKEFTLDDFSHEHLSKDSLKVLSATIKWMNKCRYQFVTERNKDDWWQLIQLLPSSYNQRRTVQLNYEVLTKIYTDRRNHKLDEWHTFCDWVKSLPHSELITMEEQNEQ